MKIVDGLEGCTNPEGFALAPEFVEIHVRIRVDDVANGRSVMDALREMTSRADVQVKYPSLGWTWLNLKTQTGEQSGHQ